MQTSFSKVISPKSGWYQGDFHAHTYCSDGTLSPHELKELAIKQGLDFLSITDHNIASAFDDFDESLDFLIIPGIEVTLKEGHFNVFGFESVSDQSKEYIQDLMDLPKNIRNHQHKDHKELTELMNRLKAAGLMLVIAHPLIWPWEWRDHDTEIITFDCIELINDPTYPESLIDNPPARRLWSAWLNAGYRTTGIGGSDFHTTAPKDDPQRIARLNLPLTHVYAQELSVKGILEGLRQHHAYVSMGPQIEFLAHQGKNSYMMGDDLGIIQSKAQIIASVENCTDQAQALLIKNGKIISQVPVLDGKAEMCWQVNPDDVEDCSWYRFDVVDREDQGLAISNPIYFGPKLLPGRHPFGRFLGAYTKA
ncbi:MAG: CehA/McbA family metallohydrolase [Anaerolineaceae bacterium]